MLYFLLTFIACIIGALGGIGGGMIIRPALDAVGGIPIATIGILSSTVVLVMAIVSVWKQRQHIGAIPKRYLLYLALGSLAGGALGGRLFDALEAAIGREKPVAITQTLMMMAILLFILWVEWHKDRLPQKKTRGFLPVLGLGAFLGAISAFLGVGGGPYNRPALYHLMGFSSKGAGVGSLVIILFSQATFLSQIALSEGFSAYDLSPLPPMILGAILGGLLGGLIVNRISNRFYNKLFMAILVLILALNLMNLIHYLA